MPNQNSKSLITLFLLYKLGKFSYLNLTLKLFHILKHSNRLTNKVKYKENSTVYFKNEIKRNKKYCPFQYP